MHVIAYPAGLAPVVQTDLAVRVPTGMQNPPPQVAGQPRHGVGVVARPAFLEVPDLGFQRFAERLVGVERQNPVVGGLFRGPVFLRGVAAPVGVDHARAEFFGKLDGAVRRPESTIRISSQQRRLSMARAILRSSLSVMIVAVSFIAD